MVYAAGEALLAADRHRFRYPLREVTRILRLVTFSGSHPLITDGSTLTAEEIVSLVLDGMLARDTEPDDETSNHRRTARRTDLPGED
jgi:hypothetical protein